MNNVTNTEQTVIVTHNGVFHADDAMAVAILSLCFDDAIQVIRTRNPQTIDAVISKGGIAVDVGGKFDGVSMFDHHQRDFSQIRPNGIKYASAGLVWRCVGSGLVGPSVAALVDTMLMQSIDAQDNGQRTPSGAYREVSVSDAIGGYNPSWHENQDFDGAFDTAVAFAKNVLTNTIRAAEGQELARLGVSRAVDAMNNRIVILDQFMPWQELVCKTDALFIVYPGANGNQWNLQAVPLEVGSQVNRQSITDAVENMDGFIFLHNARFLAAFDTKENALKAAHSEVG